MMTLKYLAVVMALFLVIFLRLPVFAEAGSALADFSGSTWHRSVVMDPVFQGETFIMESGKKSKQSIVLIHGVGDEASRIWEPFLQEYGEEYHLIAFDLPGFGRSSKQNLLYSPDGYSAFLEWVIREYAQGPVVLLGHSMGGALALHFAALYPEQIERLILVDAAGILHRTAFSKNFLQLDSKKKWPKILATPLKKPIAIINHITGTAIERVERGQSGQDIDSILSSQSLRKSILGGKPKAIASLAVAQEDFSPLLDSVRAPTYIIWGDDDEITPVRTGKALTERLPAAKLEIIDGAGHTPLHDQKLLFHQAVRRALVFEPKEEPFQKIVTSGRKGICNNSSGVTFSGSYESIDISKCTDVLLLGVTARYVNVKGSNVTMEKTLIRGKDIGLFADHSKIVATGLTIDADVAIYASGSRLDLAAVKLLGKKAAVQAKEQSFLLFSISRIDSPFLNGNMHGIRYVTEDTPM